MKTLTKDAKTEAKDAKTAANDAKAEAKAAPKPDTKADPKADVKFAWKAEATKVLPRLAKAAVVRPALSWNEIADLHERDADFRRVYENIAQRIFLRTENADKRVFLVTSAVAGEGKTMTAVNLAAALARGGQRTLLIDGNRRHPAAGPLFGSAALPGLTEVLSGETARDVAIVEDARLAALRMLPVGRTNGESWDVFVSSAFQVFVDELRQTNDYVLIDAPAMSESTDPASFAKRADGVLLVVACDRTPRKSVLEARDRLLAIGANIIGVVMNRVPDYVPSYFRDSL